MEIRTIQKLNSDFSATVLAPNGKEIQVFYALPGDLVHFESVITKKKKPFYKINQIESISVREPARCNVFGACGGCAGQHLSYDQQMDLKFSPLVTLFQTRLGFDIGTKKAKEIYEYRSRMDFSVFPGPILGQRARGNFRKVIPISQCSIQSSWANDRLQEVTQVLQKFPNLPWDRKEPALGLKYLTIRKAQNLEDGISIFTFTDGIQEREDYLEFRSQCQESIKLGSIVFCFNRPRSEVSAVGPSETIRGRAYLEESLFGNMFRIPFDSFFQPNPNGFLPILEFLNDNLPNRGNSLLDLFCGNGFFSRLFGRRFEKIHGFELSESSIEEAKQMAEKDLKAQNFHYESKNLFTDVQGLPEFEGTVAIVDPPRAGMGIKLANWFLERGPSDLFYVSCNPYSQLSELEVLQPMYKVQSGLLTDPFPHTPHIESVIHLARRT